MNRLKLLIFALPLALWLASFLLAAEGVVGPAQQQGFALAAQAPNAVNLRVAARHDELQLLAARVAASAAVTASVQAAHLSRAEPMTPEKFALVRSAVFTVVPAAMQTRLVLGVSSAAGDVQFARGAGDSAAALPGFEPDALLQAGSEGMVKEGLKEPYFFFALPLSPATDKQLEGKAGPTLVLGTPVLAKTWADEVAQELQLEAVGLFSNDNALQQGGARKALLVQARKAAMPGKNAPLKSAPVSAFGPLALPYVGGKDVAHLLVARRELTLAPVEVVSVASAQPVLAKLAEGQRSSIICFLGALGIFLLGLVVMGGGRPSEAVEEESEEKAGFSSNDPSREGAPPQQEAFSGGDPGVPLPSGEDPFASFSTQPSAEASTSASHDAQDPGGGSELEPQQVQAEAGGSSEDHQPTMAYQLPPPPEAYSHAENETPYNPDATRVAAIPSELLRASARPYPSDDVTAVAVPSRATSAHAAPDQAHFEEVFREFVATRTRCGEVADGLTFEKFAAKLRKNREQLIQKYNCRSVRFQVYVKEGKAALKATPLRD